MGFDPKTMNTTALAYIGDAVYEIYVRERVLAASGQPGRVQAQGSPQAQGFRQAEKERQKAAFGAHVDALHKRAIRYVRADGQAKALRAMMRDGFLTAEEEALVRRARNHKSASKPKNADAMDYKYATALEALIGYWHLTAASAVEAEPEHAEDETPSTAETSTAQIAAASAAETHAADAQKRMEEIIYRAFAEIER